MRDSIERDLAIAESTGAMASEKIRELEAEVDRLRSENINVSNKVVSRDSTIHTLQSRLAQAVQEQRNAVASAFDKTEEMQQWRRLADEMQLRLQQAIKDRDELSGEMETCHALLDQFYSEDPAMTSADTLEQRLRLHLDELRPIISDDDVNGDD